MDDTAVRVARLNDSNYHEWVIRMEAVLIRRQLWDMISFSVPKLDSEGNVKDASTLAAEYETMKNARDRSKMAEARAELILRVEDGQLSHMRSNDPLEVWQTLERVHQAAGFATSLALRRKFLTSKKPDTQSMQAWIGHIQALAFRMEQAGISVTEQDRILALTMGLPETYDAVIINFDSTPTDLLTLNHVVTRLLNEEVRQAVQNPEKSGPERGGSDEALAAVENAGRGRRRGITAGAEGVTCYFCDKKGHYKSECPERQSWEKAKKKSGASAAAVYCESDDDDDEAQGAF